MTALVIGIAAIVGYFLLPRHWPHVVDALPFLLLLACPLMHIFMHGGHGAHGGSGHSNSDGPNGASLQAGHEKHVDPHGQSQPAQPHADAQDLPKDINPPTF